MSCCCRKRRTTSDGDRDEPRLADEGLSADHSQDLLPPARLSGCLADLRLAGNRPAAGVSGIAQIPGVLAEIARREAAFGPHRVRAADPAGWMAARNRVLRAALNAWDHPAAQVRPTCHEPRLSQWSAKRTGVT